MKALVFNEKLELVNNHQKPVPVGSEALVKVLMTGICNTDLEIVRGYQGFRGIPGHELLILNDNSIHHTRGFSMALSQF